MASSSLSPSPFPSFHKLNPLYLPIGAPIRSNLSLATALSPSRCHHTHVIYSRAAVNRRISAGPDGSFLVSEANPAGVSEEIAPVTDDGVSLIISVLLSIAFVGLSILTIGVIYIAVTDYLQKREKDKFEKEEAAKAKKGGKKKRVRARAGPKGFGQKIEDEDDL